MSERNKSALPYFLTKFIGREEEVKALRELIETKQLVTVTGISGIGKTRLSVEVASKIERQFEEGIRFISLEGVGELLDAIRATADSLPLSADKGQELRMQLFNALSDCDMLLVFDAAEEVVSDEFADWISELLRLNSSLRLLVTSQRPINLYGEQIFLLKPMVLPSINGYVNIRETDSVRLLATRARERISGWRLTDDNAQTVAKICSVLDGIPLALELAAGQLVPGGEESLLAEIENGRSRLVAAERNRPVRHRSMTVVLERAWSQLSKSERQVLERLSLLNSGSFFDTDVTSLTKIDNGRDIVERLHRMGLLQVENSLNAKLAVKGNRYRMLNIVRKYGRTRLNRDRKLVETLQKSMARYYLNEMAEQAFDLRPETRAMAAWLRVEGLNIRQCCQWALELKNLDLLCEYVYHFQRAARGIDDLKIIRKLATTAIEIAKRNPIQKNRIAFRWDSFYEAGFVTDVMPFLEATLAQAHENEDAKWIIFCLLAMSELQWLSGNLDSAREYLRQLEVFELGKNDLSLHGEILRQQSMIAWEKGEFEEAERLLRQSIDIWKELGVVKVVINLKKRLATFFEERGDLESAVHLHEEVLGNMRQGITWRLSEKFMQWTQVDKATRWMQKIRWKHYLCGHLHAQRAFDVAFNNPEIFVAVVNVAVQ